MMDHLARAAAALDWQDDVVEDTVRQAEPRAAVTPEPPRLSESEIFASLCHPFGRIRTQRDEGADSPAPSSKAGPSGGSWRPAAAESRIAAFPGGGSRSARRPIPLGRERDGTLDAERTESAFAGRVQGITDTF